MSVAGILLAVAVPSFKEVISSNRETAEVNTLVSALNLARSEAVKRGTPVTLCQSSDGAGCTADGGYENGWLVFADPDGDGSVDGGEVILRVSPPLQGNLTLRAEANFAEFVSFLALGTSRGNGGAGNGNFRLCDSRGAAKAFTVNISNTGRISSSRGAALCP
ncbi:hypothetical protein DESUT3_17170 [Desulfuromonas versatilis]|uniref:Type II secretion system protein H n=2 Tax=Desulfuromonas versatilis TaxID=2802975 RepID=A0ABM8HRR4_9BACT|nr:hypothetical protein DESUT3_17170 [Desulfuromonas versatilis]